MSARRSELAELAERVGRDFASERDSTGKQLRHSVISFAKDVDVLMDEPLADGAAVATQIREVKDDPSGEEQVMQAVQLVTDRLRNEWKQFLD
jgi:hypothetical protein